MKSKRSFTLIELMLVLVIMAMFAGMVMPAMSRALRGAGLETTGDKLCETLNFAYASAVSRKRPVVVNIAPEQRRCWVSLRDVSLPWLTDEGAPQMRTLATMKLPESIRVVVTDVGEAGPSRAVSEGWDTVTFRSDGRTDDLFIELTDKDGGRLEIEVVGATGQVRIRGEL